MKNGAFFSSMFWIDVVVEQIAFEVDDFWKICVLQRKYEKIRPWINKVVYWHENLQKNSFFIDL
jgi:hypothetical protein